jgi:hypothetical protein
LLDEELAEKHTLLVYGGGARLEVTGGRVRGVEKGWGSLTLDDVCAGPIGNSMAPRSRRTRRLWHDPSASRGIPHNRFGSRGFVTPGPLEPRSRYFGLVWSTTLNILLVEWTFMLCSAGFVSLLDFFGAA